jgi:hypothetical protein
MGEEKLTILRRLGRSTLLSRLLFLSAAHRHYSVGKVGDIVKTLKIPGHHGLEFNVENEELKKLCARSRQISHCPPF